MYNSYVSHLTSNAAKEIHFLSEDSSLDDADLVHIIACWDKKAAQLSEKAHEMGIPYIVTPLGGISKWNMYKPRTKRPLQCAMYQKKLIKQADAVMSTTDLETNYFAKIKWNTEVYQVANCIFTNKISPQQMAETISALYYKVFENYEKIRNEKIKASITSENAEADILTKIMIIHSRMPHHNIPVCYIEQLNALLNNTEYSDDIVKEQLEKVKLTDFAAELFFVMSETMNLTEGFMPLPPLKNRKTKTIKKYIK
nr:glycosyl transferase family 1 [Prevotella sp.]